jgi:potassium-transporting ATPase KdpC subunit
MKEFFTALRLFVWMTLILGIIYPLLITTVAQTTMSHQANGSLVKSIGSKLIGQKFTSEKYFWGRPSATDYNPIPSGASNFGPTSKELTEAVKNRLNALIKLGHGPVPKELLYSSGSGLDPHISPETARFQMNRIIKARNLDQTAGRAHIEKIILENTQGRWFGILGQPTVNVLELNVKLDE